MCQSDSYWNTVTNNYYETKEAFNRNIDGDICETVHIDAWKTDDDNEEGTTIARVIKTTSGDVCVAYQDGIARHDKNAQKIIKETVAVLRGKTNPGNTPSTESENTPKRTYWCRVGMSINVTDDEYRILCGENRELASETLVGILRNPGKSRIEGETYFPEEAQYECDGDREANPNDAGVPAICENDFDLYE